MTEPSVLNLDRKVSNFTIESNKRNNASDKRVKSEFGEDALTSGNRITDNFVAEGTGIAAMEGLAYGIRKKMGTTFIPKGKLAKGKAGLLHMAIIAGPSAYGYLLNETEKTLISLEGYPSIDGKKLALGLRVSDAKNILDIDLDMTVRVSDYSIDANGDIKHANSEEKESDLYEIDTELPFDDGDPLMFEAIEEARSSAKKIDHKKALVNLESIAKVALMNNDDKLLGQMNNDDKLLGHVNTFIENFVAANSGTSDSEKQTKAANGKASLANIAEYQKSINELRGLVSPKTVQAAPLPGGVEPQETTDEVVAAVVNDTEPKLPADSLYSKFKDFKPDYGVAQGKSSRMLLYKRELLPYLEAHKDLKAPGKEKIEKTANEIAAKITDNKGLTDDEKSIAIIDFLTQALQGETE